MTDIIRLHNVVYRTKVLGPGERFAIWFQGCKRRCKGCMSESSRPLDGGRLASISKLCDVIFAQTGIEGVTISGGEPFLQPEALYSLLNRIRNLSSLGVIVYTGFTIEQLRGLNNPWIDKSLNGYIDLLIDGEYTDELNDGKSLKGSSNQRVIFLTDRYLPEKELYEQPARNAEVRLSGNEVFFIGIPSKKTWEQWRSAIEEIDSDCCRRAQPFDGDKGV